MTDAATSPEDRDPYEVKLEVFEGPLDLLLYLIRKDELDVYDIPIAHITAHYLGFLSQIPRLDLDQAGDFILMAATLMKLKSQLLLPRDEIVGEEGEEDLRDELVRRLLEYQQFKEIAEWLYGQRSSQRDIFLRRQAAADESVDQDLQPVSLFELLSVYKHIIDTVPASLVHRIIEEEITIEACVERVLGVLAQRSRVSLFELVQGGGRDTLIATFVSILELLKGQRIRVQQAQPFDEIWIERLEAGPEVHEAI
jgi:segregation and condensation protein A